MDDFPHAPYDFPQDLKKVRTRIRRYERSLRQEQERFGHIGGGYGKRYLLGPLYLLMGDTDGVLQSYTWFDQTFAGDSDEPLHLLCWALVLYRVGKLNQAEAKLRQTMLSNVYLVPHLLGMEQEVIEMWHPSNLAYKSYVACIPESTFHLWEPPAIQWANTVYHNESTRRVRERYIELYTQLKKEPRGPRRSELLEEACQLPYGIVDSF
jgi:hypothetical protein